MYCEFKYVIFYFTYVFKIYIYRFFIEFSRAFLNIRLIFYFYFAINVLTIYYYVFDAYNLVYLNFMSKNEMKHFSAIKAAILQDN